MTVGPRIGNLPRGREKWLEELNARINIAELPNTLLGENST